MKITKPMNRLLWVLQIVLALYNIAGGLYLTMNYEKVASVWAYSALPKAAWVVLGGIQVVLALGLIVPRRGKVSPKLTSIAAIGLAVISLLGMVLYIAYARFPGTLWAIVPAIVAAFIAYKRWR